MSKVKEFSFAGKVTIIIAALLTSACTHTRSQSTAESVLDNSYQAPTIDLNTYQHVQSRIGPQSEEIVSAVAISGGGHRAANFGVGVMMALEELDSQAGGNILQEIDYFSTVSGGSFAAASYFSALFDSLERDKGDASLRQSYSAFNYTRAYNAKNGTDAEEDRFCRKNCKPSSEVDLPVCVQRNIERGYHDRIAAGLGSPKIWLTNYDRGDLLEKKIDRRLLGSCWREDNKSITLGDIFIPSGHAQPVSMPYWVNNATVFENGAIFPFTPDILEHYQVTEYDHGVSRHCIGESGECDTPNASHFEVPVSVGLKASATFPGVVAATTLKSNRDPKNPYLHLFDGGLSDNMGVLTALDLINKDPLESPQRNNVLIIADAYRDDPEPYSSNRGSPNAIFQVSAKTTDISLDSWHGRYRNVINKMSATDNIQTIELSFSTLESATHRPDITLDCGSIHEVLAEAKSAGTRFNVDREQQAALVCAGYLAVAIKRDKILQAFASGGNKSVEP